MGDFADDLIDDCFDQWAQEGGPFCLIKSSDYRALTVVGLIRETEKAWLVELELPQTKTNETDWFPKSQCELELEENRILIPIWLSVAKGYGIM